MLRSLACVAAAAAVVVGGVGATDAGEEAEELLVDAMIRSALMMVEAARCLCLCPPCHQVCHQNVFTSTLC